MDNVNAHGQKMATPAPYKPTLWDTLALNMHDTAYLETDEVAITRLVEALFNSQMPPARLAALIALQHGGYHFYCPTGQLDGQDISAWLAEAQEYYPHDKAGFYTILGLVVSCPSAALGDLLVAQVYNPDQTCFKTVWAV